MGNVSKNTFSRPSSPTCCPCSSYCRTAFRLQSKRMWEHTPPGTQSSLQIVSAHPTKPQEPFSALLPRVVQSYLLKTRALDLQQLRGYFSTRVEQLIRLVVAESQQAVLCESQDKHFLPKPAHGHSKSEAHPVSDALFPQNQTSK